MEISSLTCAEAGGSLQPLKVQKDRSLLVFGATSRLILSFIEGNPNCLSKYSVLIPLSKNAKAVSREINHWTPKSLTILVEEFAKSSYIDVLYVDGATRARSNLPSIFFSESIDILLYLLTEKKLIERLIIVGSLEAITPNMLSRKDEYRKIKKYEWSQFITNYNANICYVMLPPLGKNDRVLGRIFTIKYSAAAKMLSNAINGNRKISGPPWVFVLRQLLIIYNYLLLKRKYGKDYIR